MSIRFIRFLFIFLFVVTYSSPSIGQAGFYEGLKAEKLNGKWGFKNTKNKWSIDAQYDTIFYHFQYGKAIVGKKGLVGVIDKKGKIVIPYLYTQILPEYKHLFPVRNFIGKWGFIHNNGSQIFPIEYDNFRYEFKDKHLLLQKDGRWGIYTLTAQEITKPLYKQLTHEDQKIYKALPFTSFEILTASNQLLYTAEADSISPLTANTFSYSLIGKKGIATTSHVLCAAKYNDIAHAYDSTCFIKQDNLWGIANSNGTFIVSPTWLKVSKYPHYFIATNTNNEKYIYTSNYHLISNIGYAEVRYAFDKAWLVKNSFNLWGCIDSIGSQIIAYRFDDIKPFENGKAEATLLGKKILIDTQGNTLLNENEYPLYLSGILSLNEENNKTWIRGYENYSEVSPLSKNFFRVHLNHKLYGVIDKDGLLILSCLFNRIHMSSDESTFITKQGNKISCFSTGGKLISGPHTRFEDVIDVCENYLKIKYKGALGFCDYDGQIWISTQYYETGLFFNGICAVKLSGKWGYINKEERLILQPYYDGPADFQGKVGILKENEHYYLMNSKGKITIEYPLKSVQRTTTGFYILQNSTGLFGLANTLGKEVIPSKYKSISPCTENLYIVSDEYHSGVMDNTGRIIIPMKYNTLHYNSTLNLFCGGIEKDWITLKVK